MADSTRYLVRSFGFRAEAFLSAQEFLHSRLRANRRIPIIFVSARASEDERIQAIAGGAVEFLRKPFSEDALFSAIQAALKEW